MPRTSPRPSTIAKSHASRMLAERRNATRAARSHRRRIRQYQEYIWLLTARVAANDVLLEADAAEAAAAAAEAEESGQ